MEGYNLDEDLPPLPLPSPDMDDDARWKLNWEYHARHFEVIERLKAQVKAQVKPSDRFCPGAGVQELQMTARELWKYAIGVEEMDDGDGRFYFDPALNAKVTYIVGKLGLLSSFQDFQLLTVRCIQVLDGISYLSSLEVLDAAVKHCKGLIANFPEFESLYEDQVKSIRYYDLLKGKDGVFGARNVPPRPLPVAESTGTEIQSYHL